MSNNAALFTIIFKLTLFLSYHHEHNVFSPLLDGVPNHDKRSRIEAKNTKLAPHTLSHMSFKNVDTLDVTCR
jgi:hypothetical protein